MRNTVIATLALCISQVVCSRPAVAGPAASARICLVSPDTDNDEPDSHVVTHPRFPSGIVASGAAFVPAGWKVEQRFEGDINGDGRADLVLLIKGMDPGCITSSSADSPLLDTNPYTLIVALTEGGGYRFIAGNDLLIPRHMSGDTDSPLASGSGVTLSGGALCVGIGLSAPFGVWRARRYNFIFRWHHGYLALVGFDMAAQWRDNGKSVHWSYNYLTRRANLPKETSDSDHTANHWIILPGRPLLDFVHMGNGLTFVP